jgi:hypothetical protein
MGKVSLIRGMSAGNLGVGRKSYHSEVKVDKGGIIHLDKH